MELSGYLGIGARENRGSARQGVETWRQTTVGAKEPHAVGPGGVQRNQDHVGMGWRTVLGGRLSPSPCGGRQEHDPRHYLRCAQSHDGKSTSGVAHPSLIVLTVPSQLSYSSRVSQNM